MSRVRKIPVLLGGPGHGMAVPELDWQNAKVSMGEGVGPDLPSGLTYSSRKWHVPGSKYAVRFWASEGLSDGDALALAWDWLMENAPGGPLEAALDEL